MVNLLTQTIGKYVGNGNSQTPSQEGKIHSKCERDAHTLNLAVSPWLSALEKHWHMHTRRNV